MCIKSEPIDTHDKQLAQNPSLILWWLLEVQLGCGTAMLYRILGGPLGSGSLHNKTRSDFGLSAVIAVNKNSSEIDFTK